MCCLGPKKKGDSHMHKRGDADKPTFFSHEKKRLCELGYGYS